MCAVTLSKGSLVHYIHFNFELGAIMAPETNADYGAFSERYALRRGAVVQKSRRGLGYFPVM